METSFNGLHLCLLLYFDADGKSLVKEKAVVRNQA